MRRLLVFAVVAIAAILWAVHRHPCGDGLEASDTDRTSREAVNIIARHVEPGNLSDNYLLNFTGSTSVTHYFQTKSGVRWGASMDWAYYRTETAACSVSAALLTPLIDDGAMIDTSYVPLPAGSEGTFNLKWAGVKVKGTGAGTLIFLAVGHVP